MRVLITGATGFLGSHVLRRFLANGGHEVAVLLRPHTDRGRIADVLDRVTVIEGTMERANDAHQTMAAFGPATVIHLAWMGVDSRSRASPEQTRNIQATLQLLQLAQRVGVQHWIGLGSQAEYGPANARLREDAPTRPTSMYGVAKLSTCLLTERLCAGWNIRWAWVRLFSAYGPGDQPDCMIPTVIEQLLRKQRPLLTRGEQRWDYLYVTAAAEAVYEVAVAARAQGVYNLGSGRAVSIRSIVERTRDFIDPQLPLGFGEIPYGPNQIMHLEADIDRLRKDVGWWPRVPLEDGLKETVAWHRVRQASDQR
jgi:nucleoside-diphosphate-sugar epimerase